MQYQYYMVSIILKSKNPEHCTKINLWTLSDSHNNKTEQLNNLADAVSLAIEKQKFTGSVALFVFIYIFVFTLPSSLHIILEFTEAFQHSLFSSDIDQSLLRTF